MRIFNSLKKFIVLLGSVFFITMLTISNCYAQSEYYLYNIMRYTRGTLNAVNDLPRYLNSIFGQLAMSWLAHDDTKTTAEMQANFANLGNLIVLNTNTQNNFQRQLTADLFGQPLASFNLPADRPAILNLLPNINDLSYATMLGLPPVLKAPASPYNYIKNASGMNIPHTIPNSNWQGKQIDRDKYEKYYATIMSIESYNGYVLSNQYADYQNGNVFTKLQNALIGQASNSNWVAQIATEELGKVLRQILMFESQSYVILTQLVQIENQLLTAQVMTNSLLVVNNQAMESLLVSNAQGLPIGQ